METLNKAKEILIKNGHKLTEPRKIILNFLIDEKDKHLTVDQIFSSLTQRDLNMGIATVYRNMQLLEELDIVSRLQLDDGVARYELALDHEYEEHHHLICLNCNKVIEIEDPCDHLDIQKKYDFEIANHVLKFYGYCSDCRER